MRALHRSLVAPLLLTLFLAHGPVQGALAEGRPFPKALPWNFVFFQGTHLMTLPLRDGLEGDAPSPFHEVDDGSVQLNEAVLPRDTVLWAYGDGLDPIQIDHFEVISGYGGSACTSEARLDTAWRQEVVSTYPIKGRATTWKDGDLLQHRAALDVLVRQLLATEGVSTRDMAQAIVNASLRTANLSEGEADHVLVETQADWPGGSLTVLLLMQAQADGSLLVEIDNVSVGGASDSDGAPTQTRVLGSADLDEDGTDELFVSSLSYEQGNTAVLRRSGNTWEVFGASSGGGC